MRNLVTLDMKNKMGIAKIERTREVVAKSWINVFSLKSMMFISKEKKSFAIKWKTERVLSIDSCFLERITIKIT